MNEEILKIENLKVSFPTRQGENIALDGVNISVGKGEIFGIIGESGCGKSMTSMSVLRLIAPPGKITGGKIWFDGEDLLAMSEQKLQQNVRGSKIAMIFQDPMTSLNPLITIGCQIMEPLLQHQKLSKKEAEHIAIDMLKQVGIPSAEKRFHEYPHTLSGGMRQRVMIAIAMCGKPKLLIADEPTTALDVTTQIQILKIMKRLQKQENTAVLLITHDIGVAANMCDRIAVMYCGTVVEQGNTKDILCDPCHPYTKGLIDSIPKIGTETKQLYSIPGTVPVNTGGLTGCRFADRCAFCTDVCREAAPPVKKVGGNHTVCCHNAGGEQIG